MPPDAQDQPGLIRSLAHRLAGEPWELPDEGHIGSFQAATAWLNSEPLTAQGLRGDGQPAGDATGTDVMPYSTGTVDGQGTYQLIRQRGPIGDRRFEIEFQAPGVEVYCFTFG